MTILEITTIFVIFCAVWLCFQIAWKLIESHMQRKQIERLMNTIYARFVNLLLSYLKDTKEVKRNVSM